jgi:hypothetical protein
VRYGEVIATFGDNDIVEQIDCSNQVITSFIEVRKEKEQGKLTEINFSKVQLNYKGGIS